MISKQLNDVQESDLVALISNAVAEGKTIDYKQALPGNSAGEKKEFLADVSSFSNTSGGDLIFGMAEAKGVPTGITGRTSTLSSEGSIALSPTDWSRASGTPPKWLIPPTVQRSSSFAQNGAGTGLIE